MNQQQSARRGWRIAARLGMAFVLAAPVAVWMPGTTQVTEAAASWQTLTIVDQEPITSGATRKHYDIAFERKGKPVHVSAQVILVDLWNPYVKLDTINGRGGKFATKQTVRGMASESGAVAAVNADFFNVNVPAVPMGPVVTDGKLQGSPEVLPGMYSFGITKDNKPVVDVFAFSGSVKAQDGNAYPIAGLNRMYYWYEPEGYSHTDAMHLYTDVWGSQDRANDGQATVEVLVQNGKIAQMNPAGNLPITVPKDGYILHATGTAADYAKLHLKAGDPLAVDYSLRSQDPTRSYDANSFKMLVGGHTILVENGAAAAFSRNVNGISGYSQVSRTAVGYSKDQHYVYLMTVDGSANSSGMSLEELQQFMVQLGVYKGVNLDGGGSTQMVARPLGETGVRVVNETAYGSERQIANSLGVFSIAPRGAMLDMKLEGLKTLLVGEKTTYKVSGYDAFYNPVPASEAVATTWKSSNGGTFSGNTFTASRPGRTTLTAASGQARQSIDVQVVGRGDIESMQIIPSNSVLTDNYAARLSVRIRTKSGQERIVPGSLFQWELRGVPGTVSGDTVSIPAIGSSKMGQLIARYDGYSTMLTLPVGDKRVWVDFDKTNVPVSYLGFPTDVTGTVTTLIGLPGAAAGNKALRLSYDMPSSTETQAAYAVFGYAGKGAPIDGAPMTLSVNALGDNSLNWLRADFVDADGAVQVVDLARTINWTGWKTLTADLSGLKAPLQLRRIYVASIAADKDARLAKGSIAIDDISFLYKNALPEPPRNQIGMKIGSRSITVNGAKQTIDQEPLVLNDKTVVPVKLIVDAMGGEVIWTESEQKVTVIRGGNLIDMWIGNPDLIVNGQTVKSEVTPVIVGDRTMVPLRLLAEAMGWTVGWDEATWSITLQ